ncbi:hypothetical protein LX90_007734 [Lentzea flava]|nr:hypothetical protein [Lentzea flava]MCP2204005.1 hypothetical protein [Lentzea flava]
MREPMARWNPARGVWETTQAQLCGHSALFSRTWPTSGTTRRGVAYALPTWAPLTNASGSSSLLPTPTSSDRFGPGHHGDGSPNLRTMVQLLPTASATPYGTNQSPTPGAAVRPSLETLAREFVEPTALLPTPRTATKRTGVRWAQRPAEQGGASGASLEQALELASGTLPHEFTSWDEVPAAWISAATHPPSNAGNAVSDESLLRPLWTDDEPTGS